MTMGERIAKKLDEMHITQRELAAAVGVTDLTLSRYIHGKRTPDVLVLTRICETLGVSANYLLGLDE